MQQSGSTFCSVRMPVELKAEAVAAARRKRWSLSTYVQVALEEKLKRESEGHNK